MIDLYPAAVLSDATLEFVLSVGSDFSKNRMYLNKSVFFSFIREMEEGSTHIYYSEFFKYLFGI